jgi:protein-L-isoaspartate(D-aspartate) O-methyltransferase
MSQIDIEQARFNMIEQQVRPCDVLDQRVLDVMSSTPREDFVPGKYRSLAFADINIPLGREQVMMAPKTEGRLLQVLDIQPADSILEIGTGSGYLTACFSRLGNHVTSYEIFTEFREAAAVKLGANGYRNVTLKDGDAANGIDTATRYNVIAVTGSLPVLHRHFHDNLAVAGRLFVITGTPPIMEALLITRIDEHNWSQESLFETSLPPLLHAAAPQRFVL